jgi:DNA-binding winged helix-turn-helix (wHTH) protein
MSGDSNTGGGFRIDEAGSVWLNDSRLELSPKALELLSYLIRNAGRVVTPDQVLESVWQDTNVQPEILKVYILELRRALDDDARNPRYIETIPRRGYRLIAPENGNSTPGPAAAASGRPLFGRDGPLGELMETFRLASGGMRQVVFVTGEPGIGKTALTEAFSGWLSATAGAHVLQGQCIRTYGQQEPYYPILEALAGMKLAGFRTALNTHAPTWLIQLPAVLSPQDREKLSRELLGATANRMLREICDLLQAVAQESTLVLVLEDVHWADAATVDFLSAVARHRERAKLMILCTFRRADLVLTRHPLRAVSHELGAKSLCREIQLGPLDMESVRGFLASEFPGNPLPDSLVHAIAEYSGGNPLFLGSIAARLRDTGQVRRQNGLWVVADAETEWTLGASEHVQELILSQAEILSSAERKLLEAASVAGTAFSVWSVAALLRDAPENVQARCEALATGHGWLRFTGAETLPGGEITSLFEFKHALYREAIYRQAGRGLRTTLQQRLAEAIEALYGEDAGVRAAELAWRYEECRLWSKAVHYLQLVAERAMHRCAPREAAAFLKRASRLAAEIPDPESRQKAQFEALRRLAQARFGAGQLAEGLDATDKLAGLATAAERWEVAAKAMLAASDSLAFIDYRRALAAAGRASELSDKAGHRLLRAQAVLEKSYVTLVLQRWNSEDLERASDAMSYIRQNCPPAEAAWHESRYASLRLLASDYEGAYGAALSAQKAAERHGDFVTAENAGRVSRSALLSAGRWGEFLRECETSIARHERNDNEAWAQRSRAQLAMLYLECFDFRRVLAVCDSERRFAKSGAFAMEKLAARTAAAYAGLGEFELALETVAKGLGIGGGMSHLGHRFMFQCAAVEANLGKGNYDAALHWVEEMLHFVLSTGERTYQALGWYWLARTNQVRGDPVSARAAIDSGLAIVEQGNVPLAAWRVYKQASLIYTQAGESERGAADGERGNATIAKLASSIGAESALSESFQANASGSAPRGRRVSRAAEGR